MSENSNTNEVLMRALLKGSASMYQPSKMGFTPNLTLPKPICSVQQTQVTRPPNKELKEIMNLPLTVADKEGMIALEHCYARPLNWKPGSTFYQPTKLLFMQSPPKVKSNPLAIDQQRLEDDIDIEFVHPAPTELYDRSKAIHLMDECERHIETAMLPETNEDWEKSVVKLNWTVIQENLFKGMVGILNNDQLGRLANSGSYHEPIQRRTIIEKSVKRIRKLFTTISWDQRLTQWIHQLLLDHLSPSYLSAYLDILQTLKSKVPGFADKMMFGSNCGNRVGPTNIENMFQLLKRPWDPFSSYLAHNKPRKLPGNPVIIIVPSAPTTSNISQFKRQHKWMNLFASLSTVVAVHTNIGNNANRLTMVNCADQMLTATRAKVQEVKTEYSGRTIILVGFNAGAALALQVAQVESVFCVICMGFSVFTVDGKRGNPDDSLLELQCPVLFVIGQCSNTSSQEDVEDLRERMRVENGLIVVGSADNYLRINKKKKRAEGITQNAVDRLIIESIGEFISGLMLSPYPPQVRQSPTPNVNDITGTKRMKIERARNNSNCSSLDSEPPSPSPKVARPVGRPPGSKTKIKLESKWSAQVAQGILPSPLQTQPKSKPQTITPSSHSLIGSNAIKSNTLTDNSDRDSSVDLASDNSSDKMEIANKFQMMGFNRSILTTGNTIPTVVPTPNKITMPSVAKHSSVLENITFNTSSKNLSMSKGVDLSKITLVSTTSSSTSKSLSNVLMMPDGKIKTICSTVKGSGGTPLLLPISYKSKQNVTQMPHSIKHGVTKYITSKKQLLGRKPPFQSQNTVTSTTFASNLPPPTNLTSQDIMDLPIIFADDNQILNDNSELQQINIPVSEIIQPVPPPKLALSNPVGKFVFLNKQQPLLQSLTTPVLKRPTLSVPVRTTTNPVKYTKIIISRGLNNDVKTVPTTNTLTKITHISPELSIKRVEMAGTPTANVSEPMDLETNLIATTIPKPDYTVTVKKEHDYDIMKMEKAVEVIKRNTSAAIASNVYDDDDPDYVPPKSVKLK